MEMVNLKCVQLFRWTTDYKEYYRGTTINYNGSTTGYNIQW